MRTNQERLIHDLLDDETRRNAHLLAGVRVLRRRRYWRAARHCAALAIILGAAGLWLEQARSRRAPLQASVPPPAPVQARQQSLSDDQLLDLFPDTPVILATLSDGTMRLIFPRPEDEERFLRYP